MTRTISAEVSLEVEEIIASLSLAEKLQMLDGDNEFWPGLIEMTAGGYNRIPYVAGALPDHGIAGIRFSDGPRGVVMGNSTCFPVAMARGASFDVDLEEAVGNVIGREVRAQGGNLFAGVCVNLLRHPAWGRAQETYGEDPVLLGEMGAALTRGVQKHVMACVKHFALNSMENARFQVDVTCDPSTLREVYLPHFKRIVDEGVASVMSAYNSVNGEWCGQSPALLTGILRDEWGFDGFVMTDFIFGMRDSTTAINAGQDLEMPFRMLHQRDLGSAVAHGEVAVTTVDTACRRILGQQLRFRSIGSSTRAAYEMSVVASPPHRALARRASAESMVLLSNADTLLPLAVDRIRRVAVIGKLADTENTGDGGSSKVRPPSVVSPLAGLREALEPLGIEVVYHDGSDEAAAASTAGSADVAIMVVGYTHEDEGEYVGLAGRSRDLQAGFPALPAELKEKLEASTAANRDGQGMSLGGDRTSLELRFGDRSLIDAVAGAQRATLVVVECGSAVLMESWRHKVAAIVVSWYPGMEGGHALADVLLGRVNPSGHLPFSIPTSEEHLPLFDRHATSVSYGPLHGQWLLDDLGVAAAFPFGFGLSYTSFDFETAEIISEHMVSVTVLNSGPVSGATVVQLYRRSEGKPTKLCGFAKVVLEPGMRQRIMVPVHDASAFNGTLFASQFAGDPQGLMVSTIGEGNAG